MGAGRCCCSDPKLGWNKWAGVAAAHQMASPRPPLARAFHGLLRNYPHLHLVLMVEITAQSTCSLCRNEKMPQHPTLFVFRHTHLNLRGCMLCFCRKNALICWSGNANSPLYERALRIFKSACLVRQVSVGLKTYKKDWLIQTPCIWLRQLLLWPVQQRHAQVEVLSIIKVQEDLTFHTHDLLGA